MLSHASPVILYLLHSRFAIRPCRTDQTRVKYNVNPPYQARDGKLSAPAGSIIGPSKLKINKRLIVRSGKQKGCKNGSPVQKGKGVIRHVVDPPVRQFFPHHPMRERENRNGEQKGGIDRSAALAVKKHQGLKDGRAGVKIVAPERNSAHAYETEGDDRPQDVHAGNRQGHPFFQPRPGAMNHQGGAVKPPPEDEFPRGAVPEAA